MNKKIGIGFVGGDLRQIRAAKMFAADGADVKIFGFEKDSADIDGLTAAGTLPEVFEGAEGKADAACIVLPLPYSSDGETINAPFCDEKVYISDVFKNLKKGQILFVGKADEKISLLAELYGAHTVDYFHREELAVLNSIPTAEGAIAIAMKETTFTLHGSRCLVIGNGRVGKVLAGKLSALCAKVSVACRKAADLAWIYASGNEAVEMGRLADCIGEFDVIFNTVPSVVLAGKLLSEVRKDALVVDLASKPGGVDFDAARELGTRVIWALSLPGKVAPDTSGDMMAKGKLFEDFIKLV